MGCLHRDDDGDSDDEAAKGTAAITSFFSANSDKDVPKRHKFFLERNLDSMEAF
jgi:hypothetical protein